LILDNFTNQLHIVCLLFPGKPHLSDNLEQPYLPIHPALTIQHPASLVRHSFSDGGSIQHPATSILQQSADIVLIESILDTNNA